MAVVITAIIEAILYYFNVDHRSFITFLIFLISYPWKIGKDIYSLFGGFNDENEGSVYSLFGLIQKGEKDVYSIAGLSLYQNAGGDALQVFGLTLYQNAGGDAWQGIGLTLYQNAGGDALQIIGLTLYQNAGGDAWQCIGLTVFSEAKSFSNRTFAVIRVARKTKIKSVVQI